MSQHPADLKPRNIKPPHGLVPWECLPPARLPRLIRAARGDLPHKGWAEDVAFACRLLTLILSEIGIDPVARVMGYGAAKYAPWNWQGFAWDREARTEYRSALFRHLQADAGGELTDPESGEPHKAHAAACCLIWIWHETIGTPWKIKAEPPAPAPERLPQVGDVYVSDTLGGCRRRVTEIRPDGRVIFSVTSTYYTDRRESESPRAWAQNLSALGYALQVPEPAPEPAEGWYRTPSGAARFVYARELGTMRVRWTDARGLRVTTLPVSEIATWAEIEDTDVRAGDWAASDCAAGIVELVRIRGYERVLGVPTDHECGELRNGRRFYTFLEGSRSDSAPRLSL